MARPTKEGLEYFPLDVELDEKFELIEADHGLIGFGVIIKLLQRVYKNGYYLTWDEVNKKLFAKRVGVETAAVEAVISSALEYGIFHAEMYSNYGILTSKGIQKRYLAATNKRNNRELIEDYLLIAVTEYKNVSLIPLSGSFRGENPLTERVKGGGGTQSKVKKSKVKNSRTSVTAEGGGEAIPVDPKPPPGDEIPEKHPVESHPPPNLAASPGKLPEGLRTVNDTFFTITGRFMRGEEVELIRGLLKQHFPARICTELRKVSEKPSPPKAPVQYIHAYLRHQSSRKRGPRGDPWEKIPGDGVFSPEHTTAILGGEA